MRSLQVNAGGTATQVRRQVDDQMAGADAPLDWPGADALYNLLVALLKYTSDDDSVSVSARLEERPDNMVHLSLAFTAVPRFKADAAVRAGVQPSSEPAGAADAAPGDADSTITDS